MHFCPKNTCYEVKTNEKRQFLYNKLKFIYFDIKNLTSGFLFFQTFLKSTIPKLINRTRICQWFQRWWMLWRCLRVCLIWRWTVPKRIDIIHSTQIQKKFALLADRSTHRFGSSVLVLLRWISVCEFMGRTMEIADKHRESADNNDNTNAAVLVSMTGQNGGMRLWNGKEDVK